MDTERSALNRGGLAHTCAHPSMIRSIRRARRAARTQPARLAPACVRKEAPGSFGATVSATLLLACMRLPRLILLPSLVAATLATTAHAETVTGTLRFTDQAGVAKPIANATVEVWRHRPGVGPFGWWGWAMDMTTATNADGQLDVSMPYIGNGVTYQLRVFATNPAAKLFTDPAPFLLNPFYREPGLPGPQIFRRTTAPNNVHDFTFEFSDSAASFFNIADAIRHGADYAAARRDPGETDTLGQVAVTMQSVVSASFYDPVTKAIRLSTADATNDLAILHEYAHYLEERISGFVGIPSNHDGCTATVAGADVMDPGFAWMEGFADYFPAAVMRSLPEGTLTGATALESPSCAGVTKPRASVERFVAAALFDLMDSDAEFGDGFCAAGSVPADTIVFQIFDRELDIGFANPSLQHFVDAWGGRGLDVPMLRRSLDIHGVSVNLPVPMTRFDMSPAANIAVFRPIGSWNSQWWVWGGQMPITDWGRAGDVPVPADYDGDGLTDLAVWRPGDGTWWVIKSGSNQWSTQQWGTAGDIPLPGDYDGDNEIDYAVYRPSAQLVFVYNDGCGPYEEIHVGPGAPVVGDFDADGVDEPGVFYNGQFVVQLHDGGELIGYLPAGGTPVVRDYDGDGKADFATFDSSTGAYYRWAAPSPWAWFHLPLFVGLPGDVPVPADYDGDGSAELATWTPSTGTWWVQYENAPMMAYTWGVAGDTPVPAP